MLVLSRKEGETIVINNDVTVIVLAMRGDRVRLGIDAPKQVPISRGELIDQNPDGPTRPPKDDKEAV